MAELEIMLQYLISIMALFGVSAFCAFNRKSGGFSRITFLIAISVGINIMVWVGIFPLYSVALSIGAIIGILFSGNDESSEG